MPRLTSARRLGAFALALTLAGALVGARARAQQREPSEEPIEPLDPPEHATPDEATVRALVDAAAASDSADGARAIGTLLLRGLTPGAAAHALAALEALARPEGEAAVLRLARHRRAALRRRALAAAGALRTPRALRALAEALGDHDEAVRVTAAEALGERATAEQLPLVTLALRRDLDTLEGAQGGRVAHGCALALARVGASADIELLLSLLRRVPLRTMAPALRVAVARADLPEALRLRVIGAVGDLATPDARDVLRSILGDARGEDSPLSRAARAAAERIAGGAR